MGIVSLKYCLQRLKYDNYTQNEIDSLGFYGLVFYDKHHDDVITYILSPINSLLHLSFDDIIIQ